MERLSCPGTSEATRVKSLQYSNISSLVSLKHSKFRIYFDQGSLKNSHLHFTSLIMIQISRHSPILT